MADSLTIIEVALAEVAERLSRMPPSPRQRSLKAKFDAYDHALRALQSKTSTPAQSAQTAALLECVMDLGQAVMRDHDALPPLIRSDRASLRPRNPTDEAQPSPKRAPTSDGMGAAGPIGGLGKRS